MQKSKLMGKLTAIVMAVMMVAAVMPLLAREAYAYEASGTMATNVPWELDDEGVLTIGETGGNYEITYNPAEHNNVWPWEANKTAIKSVEFKGNHTISNAAYMFAGCTNLETFTFAPDSLDTRGTSSFKEMFRGCGKLKDWSVFTIYVPEQAEVTDMFYMCMPNNFNLFLGREQFGSSLNNGIEDASYYITKMMTPEEIGTPGAGYEHGYPTATDLAVQMRVITAVKAERDVELNRLREPYINSLTQTFNGILEEIKTGNVIIDTSEENELIEIFEEGKATINNLYYQQEMEGACVMFEGHLNNAFTVMTARHDAVNEISEYRGTKVNDDYYDDQIAELDSIKNTATTALGNANTLDQISAIVTQAKADMDAVKTKEVVDYETAKAALKAALDDAATLQVDDYMDDSFGSLTTAVTAGQSVYDNSGSTLAQIQDATAAIAQAKGALVEAVYVTFESNGGTPIDTVKIAKGDSVARPDPAPNKEEFEFVAWYKDDGTFKEPYDFEEAVNSNLTLFANWTKNTFEVKFESNGGTVIAAQPVEHGAKAVEPNPAPTKDGFEFSGWYRDSALEYKYNFDDPVYGELTLYAKWTQKTAGGNQGGGNTTVINYYNITNITEIEKHIPAEVSPSTPAPAAAVDALITKTASEADVKGSSYAPLQLQSKKQTKNSITLKWSTVKGATQYVIYGNKCGKNNKYKKIATVGSGKKSYVVKTIAKAKLTKGSNYKFIVKAVKGKQVISISKSIHITTAGHKKNVNHSKVTVKNSVIKNAKKLKKGKTLNLKAKAEFKKGKKVVGHVKAVRYESSNKKIATVNAKGKVKGIKKGTCYIYAYAQNGVCKKIKITVK